MPESFARAMVEILTIKERDGPLPLGLIRHYWPPKRKTPPGPFGMSDGEQVLQPYMPKVAILSRHTSPAAACLD